MKIKFKDSFTGRWLTQEVVLVEDLRPRWEILRFITTGGYRIRWEDCIELPSGCVMGR